MREKTRPALQSLLIAPDPEMRRNILSGIKTGTLREGYRGYHKGFCLLACPDDPFCVGVDITDVRRSIAWKVREEDYRASGFESKLDMIGGLRNYYPNFDQNSPVTAIRWANVRGKLVDEFRADKNRKKRIHIICPVRGMTDPEKTFLDQYVTDLEGDGSEVEVHYPPRNVEQDDPIGIDICTSHRDAMRHADEVHVYWNRTSEGSKFDLGMAFMLQGYRPDVPIKLINFSGVEKTPYKSFDNVLIVLDGRARRDAR